MNILSFLKRNWFTVIYTIILTVLVAVTLIQARENEYKFVRGFYGTYCYPAEEYPPTIKYVLKYETLKECLESIPVK